MLRRVSGLRGRLGESLQAFRAVFQNPNLRRLQLAWAGSIIGHWAYGIALAVYAYDEGGVTAVGVVGLVRMLPAAIAAPFMSALADRYPRERIMLVSDRDPAAWRWPGRPPWRSRAGRRCFVYALRRVRGRDAHGLPARRSRRSPRRSRERPRS